jgi:hypothetical protein
MSHKVGRNDPCPCGSGKKYKKCCMNKADNVLRFPSGPQQGKVPNDLVPPLAGFDPEKLAEYQAFAESWDEADGPVPTFMQYFGMGNAASDALDDLKRNLEGMDIESEKELRTFADMNMKSHNNTPMDDLLGLSPVQMRHLLDTNFESGTGAIRFSDNVDPELYKNAKFVRWTLWLFLYLDIAGEVELNDYDQLPDEVIDKFVNEVLLNEEELDVIMSELKGKTKDDLIPILKEEAFTLNVCFLFLCQNGYVKKRKGLHSLTAKVKKIVNSGVSFDKLFIETFVWMCHEYNWSGFYDFGIDMEGVQKTLAFSLYIIHSKCQKFTNTSITADYFFKAFGHIIEDNELSRVVYNILFLDEFAELFGLIDITYKKPKSGSSSNISVRESELARQLFVWDI